MAIKNYTTSISVAKTLMEIQKALVKHKAKAVLTEYDDEGIVTHVSFKIETQHGLQPFRLPANMKGVEACLHRNPKVPKRLKTREQASRVAWRIVKDWVEAQLAIVEADMVELVEVFLPYAQCSDGKTIYERFLDAPNQLLLDNKTVDV